MPRRTKLSWADHELIADLDGVLRIFSAIMRVSQIERLQETTLFGNVDIGAIAMEAAELLDAAAEEKNHVSHW